MLLGHPLSKVDRHLGVDHAPALPLTNIYYGQIQHFQQAVIGGKDGFGLGRLAQLAVKALNGVGGMDQPPYLLGMLEVSTQVDPIILPELGNFRVFLVSLLPKASRASSADCLSTAQRHRLPSNPP